MKKNGPEDSAPIDYAADARALEAELALVVRTILAEEMASPEFKSHLHKALKPALQEILDQQKKALQQEVASLRPNPTASGRSARRGAETEEDWNHIPLAEDVERRPPIAQGTPRERENRRDSREEERPRPPRDDARPSSPPRRDDDIPNTWKLALVIVGSVLLGALLTWAILHFGAKANATPSVPSGTGSETSASNGTNGETEPTTPPADPYGEGEVTSPERENPLAAIWRREIGAAQRGLAPNSPLLDLSVDSQFDCFFPSATREELNTQVSARRLGADSIESFDACVARDHKLIAGQKNDAVFAAQVLAQKLLSAEVAPKTLWCANPPTDLKLRGFKADGAAGKGTWQMLDALLVCADFEGAPKFTAQSPAEAYLVASYVALRELQRIEPAAQP